MEMEIENIRQRTLIFLLGTLAMCMPILSVADDCVGWLRVQVPSNGVAAAAMTFEPMADGVVSAFLSGPFEESSASNLMDELIFVDGASGTVSRAMWTSGAWRDPASGEESDLSARPSDSLVFRLQPSEPFDAFVFGRVPCSDALASSLAPGLNLVSAGYPSLSFPTSALPVGVSVEAPWTAAGSSGFLPWTTPVFVTNANPEAVVWTRSRPYAPVPLGVPRVRTMSVDPLGAFADFSVDAQGATDVLKSSPPSGLVASASWTHLARFGAAQLPSVWRDASLGEGWTDSTSAPDINDGFVDGLIDLFLWGK